MTQGAPTAPLAANALAGRSTQDPKNQRRSPRRRVLKEGKLIFGQGHSVVDCTIDNQSDGGAHIRITSSHGVPEVAWRTTTGMGLRILGPLEDAAAREALLRKFRRNTR
jgi:hypothetical protein